MNYAIMMLIVLSIWMALYFVVDEKIEKIITKVDVATLLTLGLLFITLQLEVRYRQNSVAAAIWPYLIYLTILVNMVIKGILFFKSKKGRIKVE